MNSGGLSEGVFESELFGHVKGAFTDAKTDRIGCFELADGGTLFLDEIGNMPLIAAGQAAARAADGRAAPGGLLQGAAGVVRVVSATNADLSRAVAEGRFREDLLYRLNTVEVQLPPLRERREDIPLLAAHFLAEQGRRYGRPDDAPVAGGAGGAAGLRAGRATCASWSTPWSARCSWPAGTR